MTLSSSGLRNDEVSKIVGLSEECTAPVVRVIFPPAVSALLAFMQKQNRYQQRFISSFRPK